jgi:hypothetical protein
MNYNCSTSNGNGTDESIFFFFLEVLAALFCSCLFLGHDKAISMAWSSGTASFFEQEPTFVLAFGGS